MDHTTKTAFARFAFPKVDPARAARAAEAMAKLHERQAAAFKLWSEAGRSAAEVRTADAADILDMVAPSPLPAKPGSRRRQLEVVRAGIPTPNSEATSPAT
ncbi:hypothetical protein ABIC24_007021 [Methylobacterium radiotolerans]